MGSGLGYIVGSKVADLAGDWRWGLRVTPILNLLALVLLSLFMLDPPRGEEHKKPSKSSAGSFGQQMKSWGEDLVYLVTNKSYMLSTMAFTCLTFCTGALSWFGPNFIENGLKIREYYHLDGSEDDFSTDE